MPINDGELFAICQRKLNEANRRLEEIRGTLTGQGFTVLGWHLNGAAEPLDSWFEDNDWDPVTADPGGPDIPSGSVQIDVGMIGGPFDGMTDTILIFGDRLPAEGKFTLKGEKTVAVYGPFLKHNSKRIAYRFLRFEPKQDEDFDGIPGP